MVVSLGIANLPVIRKVLPLVPPIVVARELATYSRNVTIRCHVDPFPQKEQKNRSTLSRASAWLTPECHGPVLVIAVQLDPAGHRGGVLSYDRQGP